MSFELLLFIGYCILLLFALWNWITKPEIERKYIIRNVIQAQVESRTHLEDSEKLQLLHELIKDINENNIDPALATEFLRIINDKFTNKLINEHKTKTNTL
jgi:hypothetical protein